MKTAHSLLLFLALMWNSFVLALGQTVSRPTALPSDVRFVSSFVAAGEPVPSDCREEARVFALILIRYTRPESWHWVLVCDEQGWRRFLRLSGRDEEASIYASTDLAGKATYIRGDKLLYPYDLGAFPEDVIAHELAHIRLNSDSEARVNNLVRLWQRVGREGLP